MVSVVSIEEFSKLQSQFLEVRQSYYELKEKEKLYKQELERYKLDAQKTQEILNKNKKNNAYASLLKEKENLERSLQASVQEHKDQQNALRANIKTIYDNNTQLQEEVDMLKKQLELERNHKQSVLVSDTEAVIQSFQDQVSSLKKREESLKCQVERLKKELHGAKPPPLIGHDSSTNHNDDLGLEVTENSSPEKKKACPISQSQPKADDEGQAFSIVFPSFDLMRVRILLEKVFGARDSSDNKDLLPTAFAIAFEKLKDPSSCNLHKEQTETSEGVSSSINLSSTDNDHLNSGIAENNMIDTHEVEGVLLTKEQNLGVLSSQTDTKDDSISKIVVENIVLLLQAVRQYWQENQSAFQIQLEQERRKDWSLERNFPIVKQEFLDKERSECDQRERDSQELQERLREQVEKQRKQMKAMEEESQQLYMKVSELQEKERQMQEQLNVWISKARSKQSSILKMEEEMEKGISERDQRVEQLNHQLHRKDEEIARLIAETSRYKEELDVVQQDRQHIISKLTDKDLELDHLRDQCALLQENIETLKTNLNSTVDTLQKERESFSTTLKQRMEQTQKQGNELGELQSKVLDLEEKHSSIKNSKEEALLQAKELSKRLSDADSTINALRETETLLRNKLVNADRTLKECEEKMAASLRDAELREKLERELQNVKQHYSTSCIEVGELNAKLSKRENECKSREIECGQLRAELKSLQEDHERTLKEHEAVLNSYEDQLYKANEREEALRQRVTDLEEQLKTLDQERESLASRRDVLEGEMRLMQAEMKQKEQQWEEHSSKLANEREELKMLVEDAKTEARIVEKKYQRICKELKEQFSKEKKQLERQLQEAPRGFTSGSPRHVADVAANLSRSSSTDPLNNSVDSVTSSMSPETRKASSSSSFSSSSLVYSLEGTTAENLKGPAPTSEPPLPNEEVPAEVFQKDIEALVLQVSELQNEKWKLEECVQDLESENERLRTQIDRKELMLRSSLVNSRMEGRSSAEMDVHRLRRQSSSSSWFKSSRSKELELEMQKKMEVLLEDTMLRNIQLQNDLKVLGDEMAQLLEENKQLKQQLMVPPIDS